MDRGARLAAPTFGVNGVVLSSFGSEADRHDVVTDLAVTPTGILAAGVEDAASVAEVARYSSDGALDTTFGQGGVSIPPIPYDASDFRALVAEPDGTVLLLAHAIHADDPSSTQYTLLMRLTKDGALDPSFQGGVVELPTDLRPKAIASYDAERVVCAMSLVGNAGFVLVRYWL